MKRGLPAAGIAFAAILLAVIARPGSPGVRLREAAVKYTCALEEGRAAEALEMMTEETADGLSEEFLSRLSGIPAPVGFVFDGTDSRGIRMAGRTGDSGTRVVWFSTGESATVVHDTALDNLLGSAVILCRESAAADPEGSCPVSGASYVNDPVAGLVVCPEGHLGDGLLASSDACALRRDSVATEVENWLEAGYAWPVSLEEMYNISSGEYGRRGGYRCPDNGYKYYELRDRGVFCPLHEETTPVTGVE